MKAVYYNEYGNADVLEYGTIKIPLIKKGCVLVKVCYCALNPRDAAIRSGEFKMLTGKNFPKLTCADFSGVVEATADDVSELNAGDRVTGYIQSIKEGCSAEYISVPVSWITKIPNTITLETAAAIPCTYLTSLQALRDKAKIKEGMKVLIYGASGGVGTAAIQLAKHFGAHVTAVCKSANADHCLQNGADSVICYDREDVSENKHEYDIIFQVYSKEGLRYKHMQHLLKTSGTFLTLIPSPFAFITSFITRIRKQRILKAVLVNVNRQDLNYLITLSSGNLIQPRITKQFNASEIREAHLHIEGGHTVGKVVLRMYEETHFV